jgi:hypothetical protein
MDILLKKGDFIYLVLGIKSKASCMPGTHMTTGLHAQSREIF